MTSETTSARETTDPAPTVPLRRNKDFQSLWVSQFCAAVGKEAAEVAYPLLILASTGSATYAGAIGSAQLLTAGLMAIPGGTLADRVDRRAILIGCNLVRLALLVTFGLLVAAGSPNLVLVFATAIGSSAFLGLSNPAALAAIKQLVPPEHLTRATVQNQIRPFGATTIGSPMGSALFGLGRAMPFLATALTFLLSTVALLFVRKPMQAPTTTTTRRGGVGEGFRFIARQPILLLWLLWAIGSNMAFNHTGAFLAIIATARERGGSESLIGVTLAVAGLGGVVGAVIGWWVVKRLRPSTIFVIAAWLGPAAAVLLLVTPGVLPLGIILGCVIVRAPIMNALFYSYAAALVPDELQGRVMGAVSFLALVSQPLGILGVGAIFDLGGPTWVFVTMGVVATLAAAPTLTRTIRTLPPPEQLAV